MKKEAIIEPCEHDIQCAVVDWCALQGIPIFAIPNGGHRHIGTAKKLKNEGVKPGVPDLFVPVVKAPQGGLFLEMKRKGGKLQETQKFWLNLLEENGYRTAVAHSVEEAIAAIKAYVGWGRFRKG